MTAEPLYPVAEVAKLWRCSADHVYDLINAGKLRTVNLGRGRAKTRVPESALAAYVKAQLAKTEPPAGPAQPTGPTGPSRPRLRSVA